MKTCIDRVVSESVTLLLRSETPSMCLFLLGRSPKAAIAGLVT